MGSCRAGTAFATRAAASRGSGGGASYRAEIGQQCGPAEVRRSMCGATAQASELPAPAPMHACARLQLPSRSWAAGVRTGAGRSLLGAPTSIAAQAHEDPRARLRRPRRPCSRGLRGSLRRQVRPPGEHDLAERPALGRTDAAAFRQLKQLRDSNRSTLKGCANDAGLPQRSRRRAGKSRAHVRTQQSTQPEIREIMKKLDRYTYGIAGGGRPTTGHFLAFRRHTHTLGRIPPHASIPTHWLSTSP